MKHLRFVLATLILTAVWALAVTQHTSAAYTGGIIRVNEPRGDGSYRLVVGFTGNAGEPEVRRETVISGSTTGAALRQWGIAQVADLAGARTVANAAALQVGQSFDLTPVSAPALTALQAWQAHASRCSRLLALKPGVSNVTLLSEITAECGVVDSTYATGFAGQF